MGFLFLVFTVTVCWIIYLFLQWTKSVNPAADGTMLDISKIENEASTDSSVCGEVKKAEVEKLETKEEKVEVERLEPDLQRVGMEVPKLKGQVEKAQMEIEDKLGNDNIVDLKKIEQSEETFVGTELKNDAFLSYNKEVIEDEFDIRIAEIIIKDQESGVAHESICGKSDEDKADLPIEREGENEKNHLNLTKSVDYANNTGLGSKIAFPEKKDSTSDEEIYTIKMENTEIKPLELQRESESKAPEKNNEEITENKNKETKISGENKEETVFIEVENLEVEVSEFNQENKGDTKNQTQEWKFKEIEEKVKEEELEENFMVQSVEVEMESENLAEEIISKESKESTALEDVKETEKFEKKESQINDRERETDILGENKNVEIKEKMLTKESIISTKTLEEGGKTLEISESREPNYTEDFSKQNDDYGKDKPTGTTEDIKERISFFEDKDELKIFEEEESKILKDLQETETPESNKEDSQIQIVNKEELKIFEENVIKTETEKGEKREGGKFMDESVDKEIGGNFDNKAKFEEINEKSSISKENKNVDVDSKLLKQNLSSELNTQNNEAVKKNISFVTKEDIQNMYSNDKENRSDSNSVKKTVIITQEGDCIENYSEEIQISEVMGTDVVHQRKIEYTEVADEEEVFYRNVTKVGDEEFVEEFQTKNEIFNEKSCSSSSVVTNEEVSSNQQTSATTITKVVNLSYTAEECSTENIEIKSFGVHKGGFLPLTDGEQGRKLDIESIKQRIIEAKNDSVTKNISENILKENISSSETVNVENTQCSVSGGNGQEINKPFGGVFIFGDELLSKSKSRELIVDFYEKGEKEELENVQIATGIGECQENTISTQSTSCTTSTSSSSLSKITTMITQMQNQNTQTKREIKQINLQNIFEKADVLPDDLSGEPADKEASTTQSSEAQSDDSLRMTSHNGSEREIVTEIPTFESEEPLIHLNKVVCDQI